MLKLAFDGIHIANTKCLYPHIDFYQVLSLFSNETQEVDGLGALNGQSQCSAPDELGQRTQGTAHAECDSVVEGLLEAVMVEQDTRGGVDVRMRVLGLFFVSISSKNRSRLERSKYIPFRAGSTRPVQSQSSS